MNNKNNNSNHRAYAYAYHPHETEVCHCGHLGCWVEQESCKDRAVRCGRCILEGLCFAFLMFVLIALCAVA